MGKPKYPKVLIAYTSTKASDKGSARKIISSEQEEADFREKHSRLKIKHDELTESEEREHFGLDLSTEQLEKAAVIVLKMLQKKKMPYRWDNLKNDTDYTFKERAFIEDYLKKEGFIEYLSTTRLVLTKTGKRFKKLWIRNLKKWYKDLPQNNWILAEVFKYGIVSLAGAIIGTIGTLSILSKFQCSSQSKQPKTEIKQPILLSKDSGGRK